MLTDLSFIATGKPWPPEDRDESDRLKEHAFNRAIYNNQHEVFTKYAAYLKDKADDDKKVVIILGWGEKATTNYVNLCIGEAPDVEINEVDAVDDRPDEEVLIDASRYGLGLYEVTDDGIFAQNPENCYLVNVPGNIRKVSHYVFFSQFNVDKRIFVKFTIHGRGFIQHLVHELKDGKLGDVQNLKSYPAYADLMVDSEGKQTTGIDELLIVRVDNALSSERRYGRSDYTPSVVSLMEALELAFARREEVLAKFSRPVLQAPESAFNHFNHATHIWEIRLDEPILAEPGSTRAEYLTWQAELGSVENAIKDKMDQLLQMLDLVKQEDLGKAESGTALAFRLIPTSSRVRRFATGLKGAIKKVHSIRSHLPGHGPACEPENVSVVFKDGIPRDPLQTTTWATMAFVAGGMSLETYVSITQGLEMSDDPTSAIQHEIARIKAAAQLQVPSLPSIQLPGLEGT
ncbi:MAG: Phage portal protein, SPP1 Gp6-like [Methanosaeta sp. PtaU1.Bin028]|nr:MAG: Phage portal protein, SPP1 Gp6-like [Methanosaeta sp. PtaU1.Bin028]